MIKNLPFIMINSYLCFHKYKEQYEIFKPLHHICRISEHDYCRIGTKEKTYDKEACR